MSGRRGNWLLATGALVGLVLATAGVVERSDDPGRDIPADAVAVVNGRAISRADYERALAALAGERRQVIDEDSLRRHVLDRLIDEELLIERGIELGLAGRDPRVRTDLSAAVIGLLVAGADDERRTPGEAELADFYRRNTDYFATPARYRVAQRAFATADEARAAAADWAAGAHMPAGGIPLPIPDALLPASKVRDYLGPTRTRIVLELNPGAVSEPIRDGAGYLLLRLVEFKPGARRPFEEVRELVRSEYLRRSGERRVRDFLDGRREDAVIHIAEERL